MIIVQQKWKSLNSYHSRHRLSRKTASFQQWQEADFSAEGVIGYDIYIYIYSIHIINGDNGDIKTKKYPEDFLAVSAFRSKNAGSKAPPRISSWQKNQP